MQSNKSAGLASLATRLKRTGRMIPVTTFAGKTVAVFGLGGSGLATLRALAAGGATVAPWDDSASGRDAAAAAGFPPVDLTTADWSQFSALILAPGVPLTHPEPHWSVHKAKAARVEIIGDVELFCRERAKFTDGVNNLAPFIAITGTNGKSTTTALIAHILRSAGRDAQMGGNIGIPILALEPLANDRFYVIEMSSFQIDLTPSLDPLVGVLLNITPDHLDRHGTLFEYAQIKARLIDQSVLAVVGADAAPMLEDIAERADSSPAFDASDLISGTRAAPVCVRDGWLLTGPDHATRYDLRGVSTLRGAHNGENAAAAFAALSTFLPPDVIAQHLRTYPGLPHRLEEIGRVGRVLFINDSKATNADSTQKALLAFPKDVFWIVGGKAKEGGIEPLRPLFDGIVRAYLIGASSDDFSKTLDGDTPIIPCQTLDVAVARANADAADFLAGRAMAAYNVVGRIGEPVYLPSDRQHPASSTDAEHLLPPPQSMRSIARTNHGEDRGGVTNERGANSSPSPNPVVLLSPACASYDQFKNFEHRGDAFRAFVHALPGFTPRAAP